MPLIGMREAGRRAGLSDRMVRLHLRRAGVPLAPLGRQRLGVEEADLAAFVASRPFGAMGAGGRPRTPVEDLPCDCPAPPPHETQRHRAQCPRGRAIRRRARSVERGRAGVEGAGPLTPNEERGAKQDE